MALRNRPPMSGIKLGQTSSRHSEKHVSRDLLGLTSAGTTAHRYVEWSPAFVALVTIQQTPGSLIVA
jgi:hypothetical protein